MPDAQTTFVEPVRRVFDWLSGLRGADGRILCPEHKVEHTGKNAGLIVMACALARYYPEERAQLIASARLQALRLVALLEREGNSTCHTFRPGRHDPYNCSNNVIDGGACSDALAELVLTFGDELDADECRMFADASVLHAQTYLRYTILDKGVPAQRAWAMTGVAGAFRLAGHEVLSLAITEGAGILEAIQHADGSYPYHPVDWGAGHVGASDVSCFYQSRVTAFLLFALERLGRDPTDGLFRGPILRGLEFLIATQGPDGVKCGALEAKPWYWGAEYEVASHPFDVYALARGWHYFKRAELGDAARRAFLAWSEHLAPSGAPRDHLPGSGRTKSYQCPVFWAGHASWMARALPDLERIADAQVSVAERTGLDLGVQHFPSASLARLEDARCVAWVRGARPGANVAHGSPHGAGLIRVFSKADGRDIHVARRFQGQAPGEWSASAGGVAPGRGWQAGRHEVRFAWWLMRNHLRGGRFAAALAQLPLTLRRGVLAYASARAGSEHCLDPAVRVLNDGVELRSALAHRSGERIPGSELERTFRIDGDGLCVEERLVACGAARRVAFHPPPAAHAVRREPWGWSYRLA